MNNRRLLVSASVLLVALVAVFAVACGQVKRPDGGFGLPDGGAGNNNTNAAFIGAAGDIPPGATAITYDLKSVAVSATNHPQIVFKLKASVNGAAATDVDFGTYVAGTNTELIPGFVGSPSAYFAFAVPQDGIAAPADFNASDRKSVV